MKHGELIRTLVRGGCVLLPGGGKHDTYLCPNGKKVSVPRHMEVKRFTAQAILKTAELD